MRILLHSSKTMKPEATRVHELTVPSYLDQAGQLQNVLKNLSQHDIARIMQLTEPLAAATRQLIREWNDTSEGTAAALTFRGDIYSGLSAGQWSSNDAEFAQTHLLILSGLYGLLRPFDAVKPYRLEMGYKLQVDSRTRLDAFWQQQLAGVLDLTDTHINLTANEYFKVIKHQLSCATVISPKFLTISPKTGEPTFVTVHAKIARGSFANWLITNKVDDPARLSDYTELNYQYDEALSTEHEPVFVCQEFGGLGLSVRLK